MSDVITEHDIVKYQEKRINELFAGLSQVDRDYYFFREQKYSNEEISLRELNEKRIGLLTFITLTKKESGASRNASHTYNGQDIDKIITVIGRNLTHCLAFGLTIEEIPTLDDLIKAGGLNRVL